ncbi:magnesium transporter [Cyclobacterium amurskyense]|uniref:Magnesium transporter MgtE n=1 Tax=Cyclobacterium amurskyense TaxID=320787 RepID=A0A0H4PB55_9BACT|nr:magnesium transporter [Cyclobacterium amurskyense]AKP50380.1 Magnesium transporter [Cyclobacterium amurskyense]
MERIELFELSKEYLEALKENIIGEHVDFIQESMQDANKADVAALLDELEMMEALFVLRALDPDFSADILNELEEDSQYKVIKAMPPEELATLIDHMDSDDAVDILNQLVVNDREAVISHLEAKEKSLYIIELLRYDEDSAGGLMAKEIIKANLNWTVVQTIDEIRRQAENVEKIFSIYVVDNKEKLLGRVALKKLILASSDTKVADLYEDNIISVPTYMEGEEVAEIMRKYDLEAIPVVNVKNKLVGRITVDDILDLIREQADEDIQAMTGISDDVEESDSVYRLSRARLPWLLIGMVGGLLGAGFIGFFEEGLNAVTALAFFIPLITATGGNVGIQSSTLVVQSLANRSVFADSLTKRLLKVLLVAILNGLVLSLFVMATVVFLYDKEVKFGLVVSIALFSVVLLASFMGTLTPIVLDKLGINPAMASGPFITTANDLLGLGVYFMVATLLLNL